MIKDRRIGAFDIDLDMINDHPDVMKMLMGNLIVLRAECLIISKCIRYEAICDEFDTVPDAETLPMYDILVQQDGDDVSVSFQKQGG